MDKNSQVSYEGTVDIKGIILRLWKVRWTILISSLLPALIILVYVLMFSKHDVYQASAYVFIGNQNYSYIETDKGNVYPNLPDVTAIVQLAKSPNVLSAVTENPDVIKKLGGKKVTIGSPTVTSMGRDQILLQVKDKDAERAVILVNAWAQELSTVINSTYYGVIGDAAQLEIRLKQTQMNYEQAQVELESAMANSTAESNSAELDQKRLALRCVLDAQISGDRLLQDLTALELNMKAAPAGSQLSLDEALALATLRQNTLFPQDCNSLSSKADYTLQIDGAYYSNFSTQQALTAILDMHESLQSRMLRLQKEQTQLETEIPQISRALENEQAKLSLLTQKRDALAESYDQLRKNIAAQQTNTWLGSTVSIPAESALHLTDNSMQYIYPALGAIIGFVLSASLVLLRDWWRSG